MFLGPLGGERRSGRFEETPRTAFSEGVLIVAPSWIGDTILMQPLLTRLRESGAVVDVLAPAWSAPLLLRMPEVARVIASPFAHGEFKLSARRRLGHELSAAGYDRAFVLPNSWKSALVPFFAGIRLRTGYTGEARIGLLNDRRRLNDDVMPLLAERYAALADPPGAPLARPLPLPHLTSTKEQQDAARAALGLPADVRPIVFCPGAEYGPAKRWPARHYAELGRRLASADAPVWLVGSAKDTAIGDEVAALAEGAAINLCGRTNLEQAIDLIATARLVVSNDSGLMHVAAALGRPLAALFGSSSPACTPPMSPTASILSIGIECSPCFQRECPLGHLKCLNDLTPDRVFAAAQGLIEP